MYFNMCGEMLYIIDQRLSAQKVDESKANKVLIDITQAMFNSRLISEVFKPHNTITFALLRSIFEKLAHSSIMRLNEQSMNKLFDLMVMVVKYQLFACSKPSDLIILTDNHLSSIVEMVSINEETTELVSTVRNQFLYHFQNRFDLVQLQLIRYSLLNLLKDIHTRVSIFLRENIQSSDGRFLIVTDRVQVECECQIPGVIRYFKGSDNVLERTENFNTGAEYVVEDARTPLGLNIYRKELPDKPSVDNSEHSEDANVSTHSNQTQSARNQQNEIDLLALLICKTPGIDGSSGHGVELKFEFLEDHTKDVPVTPNDYEETPASVVEHKSAQSNSETDANTGVESNQQHLIEIIKDLSCLDMTSDGASKEPIGADEDEIDYLELMDS